MKIIKNYATVKDACEVCKSILEIEEKDILYLPPSYPSSGSYIYTCAVCGSSNIFDEEKIPKTWPYRYAFIKAKMKGE